LEQGNDLRMPVFERWLLDSRLEGKSKDPIFPLSLQPASSPACHRLLQELIQNGINETRAKDVVAELCRKSNLICQELACKAETYERTSPLEKGDCMDLEDKGSTITMTYSRKKWTKPFHFSLNKSHYEKLKGRFFEIHGKSTGSKLDAGSKKIAAAFHVIIVAMMLRYSSVSGGQLLRDLRGGGMQGAIHEQVFDVLQQHWDGPWTEGFASPFNVYLPIFGSAFPAIDWHFGSIGSFVKTDFVRKEGCCCEANPPFSPGVMTKMVDHIDVQLAKADRHGTLLTFVVVVPTVGCDKDGEVHRAAAQSFQRMVHSESCRLHIQLAAREHGYVEGAQHLRATRYKQSSYDTSVIILQSQSARDQLFDEIEVEKKIQAAFASKHETELIKRKLASGC
jgi:phosphorylated CTD-interacting factor 1